MRRILKEYFSFSKKERNGILVLVSLVLVQIIVLVVVRNLHSPINVEVFNYSLPAAESISANSTSDLAPNPKKNFKKEESIDYFDFDPNTLSKSGWLKLGFSDKQVNVILKYRNNGGTFKEKEDLKKVYSVSEEKYQELKNYITIQQIEETKEEDLISIKSEKKKIQLDINTASAVEFKAIKGIGPVLSERIVKYRDKLGGFIATSQLTEVYGVDSLVWVQEGLNLSVDASDIKKISLNHASAKELSAHPYIDYNLGRTIVNYRSNHGPFSSLDQLSGIDLVNKEIYTKIVPYLKLK